jgi:hypothetical protein
MDWSSFLIGLITGSILFGTGMVRITRVKGPTNGE